MQDQYQVLIEKLKWQQDNNVVRNKISEPLNQLITSKGSLTKALSQLGSTFSVNVLSQRLALPLHHEQQLLKRSLYWQAVIRQVELKVDENVVVFARSVLPLSLIKKNQTGLANLGQNPLGHLLFKEGEIRVSKRQYAVTGGPESNVFARRTPYEYMGSTILVNEYFLPSVQKLFIK